MAISNFNKMSGDTRGVLFNWTALGGGNFAWYWPAAYANVAGELDASATALGTGLTAAAASIAAADGEYRNADRVARVAAEACARYCGPGFRAVRQAAISERQAVASARYSLKQPVEATGTPNSTMVDYLYRQDVRQQLADIPGTLGDKFAWLMATEGTRVFNAVAPYLELTAFTTDKDLSDLILNEWFVRKTIKFMLNDPSDNYATPADPLKNKMDDSSIRLLAEAKIGQIKLREEAVDYATKLLVATIDFTSQSSNLTDTQALDLLMGKSA